MIPIQRNLTVACGLALATASALAAPPMDVPPDGGPFPPPMMGPGHDPVPPYLRGIALTAEQRDRIFEIMHAQAPALRTRERDLRQARDALMKLSLSGDFDDIRAKLLADSAARVMSEMSLARAHVDNRIYRLLTPDQRKQVDNPRLPDRDGCDGERPRR